MTTATMPERATGRKLGDVKAVAAKLDCSDQHGLGLGTDQDDSLPVVMLGLVAFRPRCRPSAGIVKHDSARC